MLAFAEPYRDRMVLPIDEPSDALYRLITHELTHIFEFDIIPRSLLRRGLPLWVDEGLADHMTGYWNAFDLMTVRDAAISDNIPPMSDFQGVAFADGRLPYNLGHAAFEFIESRWGKEGLRQFLFALRKNVIGGGESAYEEAFRLKAEEFDEQFDKYLKDRFKPFRDKERPQDYGKNLAPKREKTPYVAVVSIEASPSGDLMAVAAGNRKEQELDIVLMSTQGRRVIRNLTSGFNKDQGFEYIRTPGGFRNNAVPWMSWAPTGDRIAYFARTEKVSTLILQNVVTRKIERRIELKTVDLPESPGHQPGRQGNRVLGAERRDRRHLHRRTRDRAGAEPHQRSVRRLRADLGARRQVDHLSGARQRQRQAVPAAISQRARRPSSRSAPTTTAARSSSTPTRWSSRRRRSIPNQPIDPEVARNGNIYNLWTLNLKTGELKQYTDTLTANVSPIVLKDEKGATKIAFVTYYKGEYGIHTLNREQPLNTVASADFGSPGPIIDFQAPLTHTLVKQNARKKGTFEKLFLEGRPPVNVGVTSGGDLFGGTQVTFTDVLGDKQFNMFAASVSQYRTMSFSYVNLSRRFQYALQAYSQTQFYYGYNPGLLFALRLRLHRSRPRPGDADRARRHRLRHLSAEPLRAPRAVRRPAAVQPGVQRARAAAARRRVPAAGLRPHAVQHRHVHAVRPHLRAGDDGVPRVRSARRQHHPGRPTSTRRAAGNLLSRQTADLDARYYMRLGTNGVLALRARGFKSWGEFPGYIYFGGNSELRGYDYLEFLGNKAFFTNAELRFPLIEAALTPIGVIGGLRGVMFFNFGGSGFEGLPMKVWTQEADDLHAAARLRAGSVLASPA